ncbi:MAG: hypothetical protein ACU841_16580 [Gammaproteobacteria bacterium]
MNPSQHNFSLLGEQVKNSDLHGRCAELFDLGLSDTQADQRGAYIAVMAILVYNSMRSELGDGYAAGFYTGALDELQVSGAADSQENIRQSLLQENQRLRQALNTAAGLLFRLEEYRCIQTDDDEFQTTLDHWRHIGLDIVNQARILLNTDYPLQPESRNE